MDGGPGVIGFHDVVHFGRFFFDAQPDESGARFVEFVEQWFVFGYSSQQIFIDFLLADDLIGTDGRRLQIHLLGFHFLQPL